MWQSSARQIQARQQRRLLLVNARDMRVCGSFALVALCVDKSALFATTFLFYFRFFFFIVCTRVNYATGLGIGYLRRA